MEGQENYIDNDFINVYFWVSHGLNVTTDKNYYNMEIKFDSLIFYSEPFSNVTLSDLNKYITDPCKLVRGACPIIPIINKLTNKKEVMLPPLLFGVQQNDTQDMKNMMGLYYLKLKKTNQPFGMSGECKILNITNNRILGFNDIFNIQNNSFLTYSMLFKCVIDDCKAKNIIVENVIFGIFSCQSTFTENKQQNNTRFQSQGLLTNQTNMSIIPANIVDINKITKDDKRFGTINVIQINQNLNLTDFGQLYKLKHQGCALNVLSYYNIIPKTDASERITCLSLNGSSIFTIVDYINTYVNSTLNIKNNSYIILRYATDIGLETINHFMNTFKSSDINYTIIVKLYETLYYTSKGVQTFSEVGHTISITKYLKNAYIIDPQEQYSQQFNLELSSSNSIKQVYSSKYAKFKFMDIIFTIRNTHAEFDRPALSITEIKNHVTTHNNIIKNIVQKSTAQAGGRHNYYLKKRRNTQKRKYNFFKNGVKKNTRYNKTKENKRIKRITYGGQKDPYEQLMTDIDASNNMPSVIML